MKALTIIQPWATLIASGHKMNETRSWKTNYRGEVLIHAGKNPKDYTSGCYIDEPDGRHFQEAGITPNNFEDLPRGSIIGKATLVNCIHINKEFRDHLKRSNPAEYAFGDYRIGRYAWVFENPVLFEKPIPARGTGRMTPMSKRESINQEPLTIEELKTMAGLPVWCP